MEFKITLTWSKVMALVIAIFALFIDLKNGTSGTVFMFSVPFIVVLVTGKQYLDRNKIVEPEEEEKPPIGYVIDKTEDVT